MTVASPLLPSAPPPGFGLDAAALQELERVQPGVDWAFCDAIAISHVPGIDGLVGEWKWFDSDESMAALEKVQGIVRKVADAHLQEGTV